MSNRQIHAAQIEKAWHVFYDGFNLSASEILFLSLSQVFMPELSTIDTVMNAYMKDADLTFDGDSAEEQFKTHWQDIYGGWVTFFKTIHQDDDVFTRKCGKIAEVLIESAFARMEAAAFSEIVQLSMKTVISIYEAFPDLGEMISETLGDAEDTFIEDFQESCLWLSDTCEQAADMDALYEDHMEDVVFIVEHTILFSAMAYVVRQKTQND